jgi:predicted Na+-dependent transporter
MGVCGHCSFRFGLQGVEPILAKSGGNLFAVSWWWAARRFGFFEKHAQNCIGFFMAMRSIAIGIGIGGEGGVLIATTPAVIY